MKLWEKIESSSAAGRHPILFVTLLMCGVALSWAGIEFLGSHISTEYSPFQTVWMRYGTHLILMLVMLGQTEGFNMIHSPRLGRQIFRSLLMLAMPFLFIAGISRGVNSRLVWAIMWFSVPMTLLLGAIMLGERVALVQWTAALIGLAGTWLFINPPFHESGLLLLLPMGAGFCFALYSVLTRAMRTERTSANLFHTALWVFIPLTFVMPTVWRTPSLKTLLFMIGIGVLGFFVLLCLDRALSAAQTAFAAPFIYTQCVWYDGMELFRHQFRPGLHQLLGLILIVGSLVWVVTRERSSNRVVQGPVV
jgi:drug/metabolite transporter (DMT)-like permease